MTVALGSAGNNFILGGKVANLSAEDAYTVCMVSSVSRDVDEAHPHYRSI